eukprot:scpid63138/ scgid27271/ 
MGSRGRPVKALPILGSVFGRMFEREMEVNNMMYRQRRIKYFRRKHNVQKCASWPSAYAPFPYSIPKDMDKSQKIWFEGNMLLEDMAIRKFLIAMLPRAVGFQRLIMDDPIIHRKENQTNITVTLHMR